MLNAFANTDPTRASRTAAIVISVVAAFVCAWTAIKLVWLFVPHADDVTAVSSVAPTTTSTPQQSLAKWHLFGNPQNPALTHIANAPATTLKLTLRGTLALADAKQGIAMIADEHGADSAYKVGDEVTTNVTLTEVFTDHIVLTHEGVAETLTMPRPDDHAAQPTAAETSHGTNAVAAANGKASSVPAGYVPPKMTNPNAIDWAKAQKQMQIDPSKIAQQVHIEPVFDGGKIAGARLSGGGDVAALMSRAGLNANDVVTAINGTPLTNLSDPQRFMDNLKNSTSLQVTVLRDGKPATLTVSLR